MFTPEFFMFRAAKLYSKPFSDSLGKLDQKPAINQEPELHDDKKVKKTNSRKLRKTQKYTNSRRVRADRCRGGFR